MSEFLNSFSITVPEISVEAYSLDPQPSKEGWKQLDQYEKDLSRQTSGDAYRYRDAGRWNLLLVDASRPPQSVNLEGGAEATWQQTRTLNTENERHREILRRTLRDNLAWYLTNQLEYWERASSQDFYHKEPSGSVKEYDAYEGYSTQVEYSDGFYLTVDPKVKFISKFSIADLLTDSSISNSFFERTYLDRYCTLMSTDRPSVKLVSIADSVSVSEKSMEIDGESQSVLEYLEDSHRYPSEIIERIDPEEPIAKVLFPWSDTPVNSAPSLLHPSPDDMSYSMTNYAAANSRERWQNTKDFVEQINFISAAGEYCDVSDEPRRMEVDKFTFPTLRYGNGEARGLRDQFPGKDEEITRKSWDDAVEAGLQTFGAAKTIRGVPEVGLLHPEGHRETAQALYRDIRKYVEEYSNTSMPTRAGSVEYDEPTKLREWVDRYGDRMDGVIVLLDDPSAYTEIRNKLGGLAAQGITLSNYQGTSSGFDNTLFNTALGFAAKIGVRPILLDEPLSSDLYLGFSVAGDTVNTAGAVALSGDDGDLVYQTNSNLASGSGSVTKSAIASQLLREAVADANRERETEIQSIVIHRNGKFGDGEIEGIKEGIEQLISSEELPASVTWSAVRIGSNARYRLYGSSEYGCVCPTGSYAELDARNGVVSTYGWPQIHQGTPHPLHCSIESASHSPQIQSVLSDVLALSFLNWGAPTMKTKEPLTTRLPEAMHEILETGARINYPPF